MPRLIDELRAPSCRLKMPGFVLPDKEDAWREVALHAQKIIKSPDLPVLLIDNVADYYFSSDQEYWDLTRDFPNLAPPFPAFWCEHKIARTIHSKQCGDTDLSAFVRNGGRVGSLIVALEPKDCTGQGIPDNARWILWCEIWIDYGWRGIMTASDGSTFNWRGITAEGTHGSTFLCIDAEGAIIGVPWMQTYCHPRDSEMMKHYMAWFNPAFLAISFLHCKNVTLVENVMDAPLAKKYRERHGVSPTPYKTLVIEPLRQILRAEGGSDRHGIQKAMHICRGHFKDYREGRGLFGKYHQLVWQPSIVRGARGRQAPPREIEVKV